MSSSKSLSAIDLLSLNVAIGWPEAVAVVLEVAERVSRGELAGVPALSDIAIDSRGTVLSSGTTSSDDLPVRGLARLLAGLLGGSSPVPELGQLIAANVAKPPALGSVAEFQRALAFFERPGRQELLAQLFERAADAVAAAEMHREVERLRAQQRADAQPENKQKPALPTRRLTTPLIAATALLFLATVGACAWLSWPDGLGAGASRASSAGARTSLMERTADRIAKTVKSLVTSEDETPAVEAREEPAKPSTPTRRRRPVKRERAARANTSTLPVVSPAVPALVSADPLPVHRRVTTHANISAPDPHVIFDATSADVAPPTIKRPQLPERTVDTSGPDTGMLELLVNEAGEVDKVKLLSPSNRFEDRMILSAAKAWRFTPAEKDGRPVRYRLRVALIW